MTSPMKMALDIYARHSRPSQGSLHVPRSAVFVAKPAEVTESATPTSAVPVAAELPTQVIVQQVALVTGPREVGIPREIESAILAVLEGPVGFGETIETTFRRKEHELGALFAKLSVSECRALHKRLENPKAGDALALRFGAMIAVRRARLLAFLQDARRREAIAGGRR
jgi:hypothetical protein